MKRLLFFISLCAILIVIILWIIIVIRGKQKTNSLQNMIDIAKKRGQINDRNFFRFGKFGINLSTLFFEIATIL